MTKKWSSTRFNHYKQQHRKSLQHINKAWFSIENVFAILRTEYSHSFVLYVDVVEIHFFFFFLLNILKFVCHSRYTYFVSACVEVFLRIVIMCNSQIKFVWARNLRFKLTRMSIKLQNKAKKKWNKFLLLSSKHHLIYHMRVRRKLDCVTISQLDFDLFSLVFVVSVHHIKKDIKCFTFYCVSPMWCPRVLEHTIQQHEIEVSVVIQLLFKFQQQQQQPNTLNMIPQQTNWFQWLYMSVSMTKM